MPLNNIILIGFMGSGKTSIGKRLAKRLKRDYCDTDQLIVEQAGRSIGKIMELQGEKNFRDLESAALESLLGKTNNVLATGGGIILQPKNQELLRQLGTVIWLHASSDILFERARRNTGRPLLEVEHPRHTFNTLLAERLSIYQSLSDLKIDTTHLSYTQTIEAIVTALPSQFSQEKLRYV